MTDFDPTIYHRRSIRLQNYDYAQAGAYFVTICTDQRRCALGEIAGESMELSGFGQIVAGCWAEIPEHYPGIEIDAFVVMPNHVHGIVLLDDQVASMERVIHESRMRTRGLQSRSLGAIVGQFKSASSRRINLLLGCNAMNVWQRNYYERVIRNDKELDRFRDYIVNNPLRWLEDEENPAQPPSGDSRNPRVERTQRGRQPRPRGYTAS